MARLVVVGVSWLLLVPAAGRGQACAEPHYRWSEKVDTTLQTRPPTPVDIAEILTNWAPLGLTNKRSEEHTSELQSQFHLVCRLLLEKKKKQPRNCSLSQPHPEQLQP